MAAAGIRDVRNDAPWTLIEPNPPVNNQHTYDFAAEDQQVAALARAGLRWFPIVDYSATWAASVPDDFESPPKSSADYAAYAEAVAKRYGPGGSFWQENPQLPYFPVTTWEIWNEENYPHFWQPSPNAAQYTDLYLAARRAIKAVDPTATVVVGGLAPATADSFVNAMFASHPGLAGEVDAFALHPYAQTDSETLSLIAGFRQTLIDDGDPDVPIQITEVGWATAPSYPGSTSESNQAAYLANVTNQVATSNCNVTRFIPYTWTDTYGAGGFGIYKLDGITARTAGRSYADAILTLEGDGTQPPPTTTTNLCPTDATPATTTGSSDSGSPTDATPATTTGSSDSGSLQLRQSTLVPHEGTVRIALRCSSMEPCTGTVAIDHGQVRCVRSTHFSIRAGATKKVKASVSRRCLWLVRNKHRRLRARLVASLLTAQPTLTSRVMLVSRRS